MDWPEKIITHSGTCHLDEYLAIALLTTKYVAPIYRVPQVRIHDPQNLYVDVGGLYDPPWALDHHQDPGLPSSLVLTIKHHFPELAEAIDTPLIRYIDEKDRYGIQKYLEAPDELTYKLIGITTVERIFIGWFTKYRVIHTRSPEYELLRQTGNEFYNLLSKIVNRKRMLPSILERAEEYMLRRNGYTIKILLVDEVLTVSEVYANNLDYHILIKPDRRNGGYEVVKLRESDNISLDKLAEALKKEGKLIFYHNTGFMLVAKDKYDILVNLDKIDYITRRVKSKELVWSR